MADFRNIVFIFIRNYFNYLGVNENCTHASDGCVSNAICSSGVCVCANGYVDHTHRCFKGNCYLCMC